MPRGNGDIALELILNEMAHGRVRVYRNAFGTPYFFCDHGRFPSLNRPLTDPDIRGWIYNFVWTVQKVLMFERDLDRIVKVLWGRSLENPIATISNPALLEAIQQDTLAATIVEFMEDKKRFEHTMDGVWRQLQAFAKTRGLVGHNLGKFPGGANVLSRKLAQVRPLLQCCKIAIEIRRSNGAKVVLTRSEDDDKRQSSAISSAVNPAPANDLNRTDDSARRIQELTHRIRRNQTPVNGERNV